MNHNHSIMRKICTYLQDNVRHTRDKQCLYVGVLAISDTIVLCVVTFPKCTGGAPHVLLALLLGAVDSGGLDKTVESLGIGDSLICWLGLEWCSIEASVSVNTPSDAWSDFKDSSKYGIILLNLLSVTLGGILLLASTDNMSAEVELLAVVWEVRESVLYKSSSPLLWNVVLWNWSDSRSNLEHYLLNISTSILAL